MNPVPSPLDDPSSLLEEHEARNRILASVEVLPASAVPLRLARGRFAAHEEFAVHPVPAFDNSSVDGYAVAVTDRAAILPAGTRLIVHGEQPAGADRGLHVVQGKAVRIFTGAPVPTGTGAVIMQEDVDRKDEEILLRETVESGENIRRAGGDLIRGQRLYGAGEKLTATRLGLLASQGRAEIEVARTPRIAVLATGDELQSAGQPLGPGEIYESNGTLLAALAETLGAEVTVLERALDERDDLDAKFATALKFHDALVVAGGVSVGERDLVKERLAAAGVRLDLWRVRIQPGKPFLYGRGPLRADGSRTHVFGLPGNPVSAAVTFLLFVRPALLKLMGAAEHYLPLPSFPSTAGSELVNRGNRPHYLRGTLDEAGTFTPVGRQESHAIFALSRSDALVRVEAGTTVPGQAPIRAYRWEL